MKLQISHFQTSFSDWWLRYLLLNCALMNITARYSWQVIMWHYNDVIMSAMTSQITGVSIVHLTVCSGADQRKHQSSASLAFVRGLHTWPVNSPHKGPVTRKMFPFDDVIMSTLVLVTAWCHQPTSHYLSQYWPRSMMTYGVTRPQYVKSQDNNYWWYWKSSVMFFFFFFRSGWISRFSITIHL